MSEQEQQHDLTKKRWPLGEDKLKRRRGRWYYIPTHLLVIAVWERQEGPNTALKITQMTGFSPCQCCITWSILDLLSSQITLGYSKILVGNLRDISQGGLELPAQVLYVLPLSLGHTLSSHEDVFHPQLLLVKQPLHNKQGSCRENKKSSVLKLLNPHLASSV